MGLEKAIIHGKERRRPYRGTRAFDRQCRNHGSCTYCMSGRLYQRSKALGAAENRMNDYFNEKTDKESL